MPRGFKRKRLGNGGRRTRRKTFIKSENGMRSVNRPRVPTNFSVAGMARATLWPTRMAVKLRFTKHVPILSSVSGINLQEFVGNNIHQVDFTAASGQPTGFDEMMQLYTQFVVPASKIKATVLGNNQGNGPLISTAMGATTTPGVTDLTTIARRVGVQNTIFSSGNNPQIRKSYSTNRAQLGLKDPFESVLIGTISGGPDAPWFWQLFVENIIGGTLVTIGAMVELTYYCIFFNPKKVGTSS